MNLPEFNEYAQKIAGVFAIAGIISVGLQMQQCYQFAGADVIAEYLESYVA